MRTGLDAATLALYLSGRYDVHARVRVANGDGTMIDLQGRWIGIHFEFPNPDQPIPLLSVDLLREYASHESGADSLAPMVQASTWNRLDDGVTYSPLIEIGRSVVLHVALTAEKAARPADGSAVWYEVFSGFVTRRPAPKKGGRMLTMHCTQRTGLLEIAKSEVAYTYAAGTPIEDAIRDALDNNGFAVAGGWLLDVPVPTGKVLQKTYAPGRQKTVWEQVWGIAQSVGMVLFPRYRAGNVVALNLFEPGRAKTVADMTVPRVHDFDEFDVDGKHLFNVGYAQFTDQAGVRKEAGPVEDADSIVRFGNVRRVFWISFAEESPVRSFADATTILGLAVSDVADPDVIAAVSTPAMPFIECGSDLYTYAADARFFDTPLKLAPYNGGFDVVADQPHRGSHGVRGKPSAGYRTWRSRIVAGGVEDDPENRNLYDPFMVENGDGSGLYTFKRGPAVASVWGATGEYPLPRLQAHKDALREPGALVPLLADSIALAAAPAGHYTLARVVAFDSSMQPSEELFGWVMERVTTPEELAEVEQIASDAVLAAAGAQAAADGKINTYFSSTAPVAEGVGDLWFDSSAGKKLYRWDGADWIEVQDQAIVDAIAAAADAQETADGKIVSFYQATTPTAEGVGDMWTDTDDDNHLHRWNGAAWVSIRDGKIAVAQATADGAALTAAEALTAAGDAAAIADGKVDWFYQASEPAGVLGDFWVDTNDGNKLYRHNGTVWEPSDDARIAQAITDAAGAQATADGKIATFYSALPPTAEAVGDLWTDTDDNNHVYRWGGSSWVSIKPKMLAVHIATIALDGVGNATVTGNADPDVAIGAVGAQYKINAGGWNDLTVDSDRTVEFTVAQTGVEQTVTIRAFQTLGNPLTAGPFTVGKVEAYTPPVPPVVPTVLSGVYISVTDTGPFGNDVYEGAAVGSGMVGKSLRVKYYREGVLRNGPDGEVTVPGVDGTVPLNWTDAGAGDGNQNAHYVTAELYDAQVNYGLKQSLTVNSLA